jgi:hypothetical protein
MRAQSRQEGCPARSGWLSLNDIDRRCKAAQDAEEARSAITSDLGGEDQLSALEKALVEHASMNTAMLRHLHVSWLKGEPAPIGEVVSLQNVFNRVAQQLGVQRRPKDIMTIDTYLSGQTKAEDK